MDHFSRDSLEVAARRVATGRLSRRQFAQMLIATGAVVAGGRQPVSAAAAEIVFCMWGGDAEKVYAEAWGAPFEAQSGIPVYLDGSGPTRGKIRAMVEAGNVTWDVCDSGLGTQTSLGKEGMLEPVDYSIVDREKVLPGMAYEWGVTGYVYSSVLTWNNDRFKDDPPKDWADFWNVEKYPGKRVVWKYMVGVLEAALMADGVAPEDVYPMDLDRALNKVREIKDHLILWDSGASSQQVFLSGEVTMGQIWHTRSNLLNEETEGQIQYTFNQGVVQPGVWVVPKGNPAGATVQDFLASMQDPERQVILLKALGNGPANPAASEFIDEALSARNPASPQNIAVQVPQNQAWYGEFHQEAEKRFLDIVSS
ncbi:ABC transporter substrate-binding protein [Rhodobacteraceae bacterium NNCM2]|nr:ABC transporter substrate-binding protein [Coraliihabitans acroporae]